MKKFISLFIVLIIFALPSCGNSTSNNSTTTAAPATTQVPQEPTTTQAPTQAPSMIENTQGNNQSNESYLPIEENKNISTAQESVITFSLKVDTASYTNIERYIDSGSLPPSDAVRIEEMLNYFPYDEKMPQSDYAFSIYNEIGRSPFDANKYLAFVRVKSKDVDMNSLPKSNLTFLIDTSGSMDAYDKLPLLKESFKLLVDSLTEGDKISIVTYAGSSQILLDSATIADKGSILSAIDRLSAGGSTAGAEGINTAYRLAEKNFINGGNNRIILATDGDFNVGISTTQGLEDLVSQKRESGIYLSILGFGTGNTRDDIMETLSKNGNGNYSYIDSVKTAEKVLVDEAKTNMYTIADDVKAQVEFNPNEVSSYRLIGYENRQMANQDFNNDAKDAGEIGIGTDVVLMFELGLKSDDNSVELKYTTTEVPFSDELFEVRIRYKNPGETQSIEMKNPTKKEDMKDFNTNDYNFAKSVAAFGSILRNSQYAANLNIDDIVNIALDSKGTDAKGYRQGFIDLVEKYRSLTYK